MFDLKNTYNPKYYNEYYKEENKKRIIFPHINNSHISNNFNDSIYFTNTKFINHTNILLYFRYFYVKLFNKYYLISKIVIENSL